MKCKVAAFSGLRWNNEHTDAISVPILSKALAESIFGNREKQAKWEIQVRFFMATTGKSHESG
jgi:hypothetical protein